MTPSPGRRGRFLVGVAAFVLLLDGSRPGTAATPPPGPARRVVYGGDANFPPFEYLDPQGQPRGFNVELLRLLARESGFLVEFRLQPWRDVVAGMDAGTLDLASMADSPDRRLRYDFVAQTWTMHQSLLFRAGRDEYPRGLDGLRRETVALLENGASHEALRALPPAGRPVFRFARDQYQALQMLAAGDATAVAGNGLTLRQVATRLGLSELREVPVASTGYYLAARPGLGRELAPLAEAFERVRTTGQLTALIEGELVLPPPPLTFVEQLRRLAWLMGGLFGVAGVAIAWSTLLRRRVRQRTAELSHSLLETARLADALALGERRFRGILEDVHLGVLLFGRDGRIEFANPSAEELLGLPAAELAGRASLSCAGSLVGEDGAPLGPEREPAARSFALGQPVHRVLVGLDRGEAAERRWLLMHADPLLGDAGMVSEVICTFADVTEERRLRAERERFFEIAPTLHLVIGPSQRVLHANPAALRVLGIDPRQMVGTNVMDHVHPEDAGRVEHASRSLGRGVTDVELRCRHADGSWRWMLWNAVADRDQNVVFAVGLDITERRRAEQQVHHLAYHDALTGLPNRQLFLDRLRMAIAHAQRRDEGLAVLFLDLDYFKTVNDTLGHAVGDRLLAEVAHRLRGGLREEDTVARLGGDEFTVIVPGVCEVEALSRLAGKLQRTMKEPALIDGNELRISVSIGVCRYPQDGESPEALLKAADAAMYRSKELGRDTIQFHWPALSGRALHEPGSCGPLAAADPVPNGVADPVPARLPWDALGSRASPEPGTGGVMPIKAGDRMPEGSFMRMTLSGPAPITTDEIFKGKKVVLFSVPGAFTPTCSNQHLPGYVEKAEEFKAKGVDTIACLAVNDVFVMDAWGKAKNATGKVMLLADGNGDYARALGLELDASKFGMGIRSKRFSMIVEDGVVKELNVEAPGEFKVSAAEATVCQL